MNWYVLYCLNQKVERIIKNLRNKQLEAFVPQCEAIERTSKEKTLKIMFPNYIFVKTYLNQEQFNDLLLSMKDINDGLIKQLRNMEVSALRQSEIEFYNTVLDNQYIIRVSEGYKEDGKTVITSGPLLHYQNHILKVNRHNNTAYLDLTFFDRNIIVGLEIKSKN